VCVTVDFDLYRARTAYYFFRREPCRYFVDLLLSSPADGSRVQLLSNTAPDDASLCRLNHAPPFVKLHGAVDERSINVPRSSRPRTKQRPRPVTPPADVPRRVRPRRGDGTVGRARPQPETTDVIVADLSETCPTAVRVPAVFLVRVCFRPVSPTSGYYVVGHYRLRKTLSRSIHYDAVYYTGALGKFFCVFISRASRPT